MDIPKDERNENDMTRTGRFCPNDNKEFEIVSDTNIYVCHWCGGQYKLNEKGDIEEVQFEGFE